MGRENAVYSRVRGHKERKDEDGVANSLNESPLAPVVAERKANIIVEGSIKLGRRDGASDRLRVGLSQLEASGDPSVFIMGSCIEPFSNELSRTLVIPRAAPKVTSTHDTTDDSYVKVSCDSFFFRFSPLPDEPCWTSLRHRSLTCNNVRFMHLLPCVSSHRPEISTRWTTDVNGQPIVYL